MLLYKLVSMVGAVNEYGTAPEGQKGVCTWRRGEIEEIFIRRVFFIDGQEIPRNRNLGYSESISRQKRLERLFILL